MFVVLRKENGKNFGLLMIILSLVYMSSGALSDGNFLHFMFSMVLLHIYSDDGIFFQKVIHCLAPYRSYLWI